MSIWFVADPDLLGSQPTVDLVIPGSRLPLISVRCVVTFPVDKHHCVFARGLTKICWDSLAVP